ncbi:hypothetical protein Vafri_17737, partial [Volvox africanus]
STLIIYMILSLGIQLYRLSLPHLVQTRAPFTHVRPRSRAPPPAPSWSRVRVSPAPPSAVRKGCVETCDELYPTWIAWVCDEHGRAYRNWCHADCNGCWWYTPCDAPPGTNLTGDSNVLVLLDSGFQYRMYTSDTQQRMTYGGAEAFCRGLGDDWDLVPYIEEAGYNAVRRLCSDNKFTCWFKRTEQDEQCPLIAADGSLQIQDCEQDVRFVCRIRLFV